MIIRRTALYLSIVACIIAAIFIGCGSPIEPSELVPYGSIEQSVHAKINAHRASIGLSPLVFDNLIATQARMHSRNMASGQVPFSHDGFDDRVTAIRKRIDVASATENVGFNLGFSDPADKAVQDWLGSPDHRGHIEGDYELTGIGVDKKGNGEYYFTQMFVKRR